MSPEHRKRSIGELRAPVANWMHVEDGKITRIRVAFDARGIAGGS